MAGPSNQEIMQELAEQRALLEKLLNCVPGAVDSEASAEERRARESWGLEMARKSRKKASG